MNHASGIAVLLFALLSALPAGCSEESGAAGEPADASAASAPPARSVARTSVAYAPYDEGADAAADVEAAIARARVTGRLVLLNFGANWCPDCRALGRAMEDPELAAIIEGRFVVAKIDVGNWDKNPDVVDDWDNPIAEGIPAIVVARPDGEILFATRRGQISTAREMGREQFAEFFRLLAGLGQAG